MNLLSIEEIDKRLDGGSIKRAGEYKNTRTKVSFVCLFCNHTWKTIPTRIWRGIGCPKCSDHLPLTNEIIDQRLQERPIRRLGEYIGYGKLLLFKCLECDFEWEAKPANVIHSMSGCPVCKNRLKQEKLIFHCLKDNGIHFEYHKKLKEISDNNYAYSVDFWLPEYDIIIEYNGKQHYAPARFGGIDLEKAECNFAKQQARDCFVQEWCSNLNIRVIWIDGRNYSFQKLENLITQQIIPSISGSK